MPLTPEQDAYLIEVKKKLEVAEEANKGGDGDKIVIEKSIAEYKKEIEAIEKNL